MSILFLLPFIITSIASLGEKGIFKVLAKSFPVPLGIMPNVPLPDFNIPMATSFTVPSLPTATIVLYP